ncbi:MULTISPECIES: gamma-glutamylcyclotransferase family protein [unclassified Microbacterium]|uniref:gamma-glutamylcyclotransferase family protein n=1 Tax=unclassified Microbacterium TaxID=2609290 RepID=UPI0030188693
MSAPPADQLLFTYGTLQDAEVQLDTFGRLLAATADTLPGYTIDYVEIDDPRVGDVTGPSVHPVLRATGNVLDKVVGAAVFLTADELDAADEYELSLHRRVRARLSSGHDAWVYVS